MHPFLADIFRSSILSFLFGFKHFIQLYGAEIYGSTLIVGKKYSCGFPILGQIKLWLQLEKKRHYHVLQLNSQLLKMNFRKTQISHFSTVRLSNQHRSLLIELNVLFSRFLNFFFHPASLFLSLMIPCETSCTQPCHEFPFLPLSVETMAHTLISISFVPSCTN